MQPRSSTETSSPSRGSRRVIRLAGKAAGSITSGLAARFPGLFLLLELPPRHRVHQHHGGDLPTSHDVITDRDLLEAEALDDALVIAFVPTAEDDQVRLRCELARQPPSRASAGGGKKNYLAPAAPGLSFSRNVKTKCSGFGNKISPPLFCPRKVNKTF